MPENLISKTLNIKNNQTETQINAPNKKVDKNRYGNDHTSSNPKVTEQIEKLPAANRQVESVGNLVEPA